MTEQLGDSLSVGAGYDLVVCALTLCHVSGLYGLVREFHRVLGPGGKLLITGFHPDTVAAGARINFSHDGVSYELPTEPHIQDDDVDATTDAGFKLIELRDLPPCLASLRVSSPRVVNREVKDDSFSRHPT